MVSALRQVGQPPFTTYVTQLVDHMYPAALVGGHDDGRCREVVLRVGGAHAVDLDCGSSHVGSGNRNSNQKRAARVRQQRRQRGRTDASTHHEAVGRVISELHLSRSGTERDLVVTVCVHTQLG